MKTSTFKSLLGPDKNENMASGCGTVGRAVVALDAEFEARGFESCHRQKIISYIC